MDGNGDFQPFFHGNKLVRHPIKLLKNEWLSGSRWENVKRNTKKQRFKTWEGSQADY